MNLINVNYITCSRRRVVQLTMAKCEDLFGRCDKERWHGACLLADLWLKHILFKLIYGALWCTVVRKYLITTDNIVRFVYD